MCKNGERVNGLAVLQMGMSSISNGGTAIKSNKKKEKKDEIQEI